MIVLVLIDKLVDVFEINWLHVFFLFVYLWRCECSDMGDMEYME